MSKTSENNLAKEPVDAAFIESERQVEAVLAAADEEVKELSQESPEQAPQQGQTSGQ